MSGDAPALRITFVDADATQPDPAAVGAAARATLRGLQAAGEQVAPAYTGEKGAAELLLWIVAASATAQTLIALPDLALKVAQLLSEIKKLRGVDTPDPQPALRPIVLVLRLPDATLPLRSDTAPADATLLAELLAERLPAQVDPRQLTVEVQVPPTPPNEL